MEVHSQPIAATKYAIPIDNHLGCSTGGPTGDKHDFVPILNAPAEYFASDNLGATRLRVEAIFPGQP
jgi:hypothetical protein